MQTPVSVTTVIKVVKEGKLIRGEKKSFREAERPVDGEKELLRL